jgi:hypothetical protein
LLPQGFRKDRIESFCCCILSNSWTTIESCNTWIINDCALLTLPSLMPSVENVMSHNHLSIYINICHWKHFL